MRKSYFPLASRVYERVIFYNGFPVFEFPFAFLGSYSQSTHFIFQINTKCKRIFLEIILTNFYHHLRRRAYCIYREVIIFACLRILELSDRFGIPFAQLCYPMICGVIFIVCKSAYLQPNAKLLILMFNPPTCCFFLYY